MGEYVYTVLQPGGQVELWRSDTTDAGTFELATLPAPQVTPLGWVTVGGVTYFDLYNNNQSDKVGELWRTDGTPSGTFSLGAVANGAVNSNLAPQAQDFMTGLGGKLYFLGGAGAQAGLWVSDGTDEGTSLVAAAANARDLVTAGGELFFLADDGGARRLWISNGLGAHSVDTGLTGFSEGTLFGYGGRLVLEATDGLHSAQLWITDGTSLGTAMLTDWNVSGIVTTGDYELLNGRLLFTEAPNSGKPALWSTDGTAAGTVELGTMQTNDGAAVLGGAAYFSDGFAIYRTDGTAAGTVKVTGFSTFVHGELGEVDGRLIYESAGSLFAYDPSTGSNVALSSGGTAQPDFVEAGGEIYFLWKGQGVPGTELWVTDGTLAGTRDLGRPNLSLDVLARDLLFNDPTETTQLTNGLVPTNFGVVRSPFAKADLKGHGVSDFLIENRSGAVVIGEVSGGSAAYQAAVGLGPEWSFKGVGGFPGGQGLSD